MVTIGRKPSKIVGIPNNRLMTARASKHLENYARQKAEHYENSLGVDAPLFYFWYKASGSIPCSCVASNEGSGVYSKPGEPNSFKASQILDDDLIEDASDIPFSKLFSKEIQTPARLDDKLQNEEDSQEDIDDVDSITDIENTSIVSSNDVLNLFNAKTINCPICLDTGYIDSWNLHAGLRLVLDTSDAYDFDVYGGIDIDASKNPTVLHGNKNGEVRWLYKLPLAWDSILRLDVYNGDMRVMPETYEWTWANVGNSLEGDMTLTDLSTLNGLGETIKIVLKFISKETTPFTHAEIVFAFRDAYRAQMPELQQGYEEEYLDWNVNASVELPPFLDIKEGDYLTESKYAKVWRISNLNRRMTAEGNIFGLAADLRALHSFERKAAQLALFQGPYNYGSKIPISGNTGNDPIND